MLGLTRPTISGDGAIKIERIYWPMWLLKIGTEVDQGTSRIFESIQEGIKQDKLFKR
jgi:hypothetical protein